MIRFKNCFHYTFFTLFCALALLLATLGFPNEAKAQPKVLYLTFDDGPSEMYTPQVLDILAREHVHATFFVLGNRCERFPRLVHRIQQEGHEIGSHGYVHRDLTKQSESVITEEVRKADVAILHICGIKPHYYRPPYGGIDRGEIPFIRKLGHPIMLWTVDSLDWKADSAATIVQNVERSARPGSVILFHDGISSSRLTIQALPILIHDYRALGYSFRILPTR